MVLTFVSLVRAFHLYSVEIDDMDQFFDKNTNILATVTTCITYIIPSEQSRDLIMIETPLSDIASLIQETDHLILTYSRNSGYQIQRGERKGVDRIRLVFRDNDQTSSFCEVLLAQKDSNDVVEYSEAMRDELSAVPGPSRKVSFAIVDISPNSQGLNATGLDPLDAIEDFDSVTREAEMRLASLESDTAKSSPRMQKERLKTPTSLANALSNNLDNQNHSPGLVSRPHSPTNNIVDESIELITEVSTDLEELANKAIHASAQKSPKDVVNSLNDGETNRSAKDTGLIHSTRRDRKMSNMLVENRAPSISVGSHRRLKRPSARTTRSPLSDDVDWDEHLRGDENKSEARATKKSRKLDCERDTSAVSSVKSKKVTAKSTATRNSDSQKTKAKAKQPLLKKAIACKRTRRSAPKSARYMEPSNAGDNEAVAHEGSIFAEAENLTNIKLSNKNEKFEVEDSQEKEIPPEATADGFPAEEAVFNNELASGIPLQTETNAGANEETAEDSYPMNATRVSQTLGENDTTFGSRMKQLIANQAAATLEE